MREIKFRGWSKDLKEILWGGFVVNVDGSVGTLTNKHDWDLELMQYTGLKDKNGRKIYEGDILTETDTSKHPSPDTIIVKWKGSGFWAWDTKLKDFNGDLEHFLNYDTEIIGNVWENPELIPKQKT